jgi:hypothetical protein
VVIIKNAVFWELRCVDLVRTDVSEERSASIIRVRRIDELGKTLAITRSVCRLLVTVNVVPSSQILVTLISRRYFPPKRRFSQEP